MTNEERIKIYNNAIDTLESEETAYWTLKEAKRYAQGYIEALANNGFITHKEALALSFELEEAIDEINSRE